MPVSKPKSEEELSAQVADAARNRIALSIEGGSTRPVGNVGDAGSRVQTTAIKSITLYEPGALTIVAKAGTPLADVEKALAAENQQLPFEPPNYAALFGVKGKSTIGGVVGTGASGPRRFQAGGARDSLIGVRFVSGDGEIIKNGGRVMKNVTGYDLVKLMCGSYGTLGILTEVSFKVLPKPEMNGVVLIEGLDDQAAIQAMAKAAGSPFDISGAAHSPKGQNGEPVTMIRVEGFTESIKYRTGRLKELLAPLMPPSSDLSIELDQAKALARWEAIRDVTAFHGAKGAVWRISVKAGNGALVADKIRESLEIETIYDWAGGLIWVQLNEGQLGAEPIIRGAVNSFGGHATLFRRDPSVDETFEAFHPEHPRIAQISEQLRHQFDPAGILNPGRMASRNLQTVGA